MLDYYRPVYLPSADELLDLDETPVDNELQELIPALLKSILLMIWETRQDWLFAIDMGIYSSPELPPIVPDAFLSLGVERCYDEELRPSDEHGKRYSTPNERIQEEVDRSQKLAGKLRQLGIDPDE
jgi:Uma2 family endonuclease